MTAKKTEPYQLESKAPNGKTTLLRKSAEDYKQEMRIKLGVDENILATRVSSLWGTNEQIYDQLARTVTAIEDGKNVSNAPSADVTGASRELLEACRKEFEEIKNDRSLTEQEKTEKRKEIFTVLEEIRVANAREKTWKWSKDFFGELKESIGNVMTVDNVKMGLLKLGVCVAVSVILAVFLAPVAGPLAVFILPVFFAAAALYCAIKLISGVMNAWGKANKKSYAEKSEAGEQVLKSAAGIANYDQIQMNQAIQEKEAAQEELRTAERNEADSPHTKTCNDFRELNAYKKACQAILDATDDRSLSPETAKVFDNLKTRYRVGDLAGVKNKLQRNNVITKTEEAIQSQKHNYLVASSHVSKLQATTAAAQSNFEAKSKVAKKYTTELAGSIKERVQQSKTRVDSRTEKKADFRSRMNTDIPSGSGPGMSKK